MKKYKNLKIILELFTQFIQISGGIRRKSWKKSYGYQNQNADKRTQTDEVLKIWKEHFEQHVNSEFPHYESILQ